MIENGERTPLLIYSNDDDELTIQMAEGWLLCEPAIFNPDIIYDFLERYDACYKVKSWAISKIQDSYRISNEIKAKFKKLRNKCHKNTIKDIKNA